MTKTVKTTGTGPCLMDVITDNGKVIVRQEERKALQHKSTTKDARAFYRAAWLSLNTDAIAPSDIAIASLSRRDRKRARYLDRLAKGKPLTQGENMGQK